MTKLEIVLNLYRDYKITVEQAAVLLDIKDTEQKVLHFPKYDYTEAELNELKKISNLMSSRLDQGAAKEIDSTPTKITTCTLSGKRLIITTDKEFSAKINQVIQAQNGNKAIVINIKKHELIVESIDGKTDMITLFNSFSPNTEITLGEQYNSYLDPISGRG